MRKKLLLLIVPVLFSSCADLATFSSSPNYNPGPQTQAQLRAKVAECEANVMRLDPSIPKVEVGHLDENGHMHMKPGYELSRETRIEEDDNGYLRADNDHLVVTHNGVRVTD
jgi:hypothetical protein